MDDFFDDFDWQDAVVVGSFLDYMVDQEKLDEEEERRRRRKHDPDYDPIFNPDDDEPYP